MLHELGVAGHPPFLFFLLSSFFFLSFFLRSPSLYGIPWPGAFRDFLTTWPHRESRWCAGWFALVFRSPVARGGRVSTRDSFHRLHRWLIDALYFGQLLVCALVASVVTFPALFAGTFFLPLTRSVPRAIYMLRTIHTSVDYSISFLTLLYYNGSYWLSNRIFSSLLLLPLFKIF